MKNKGVRVLFAYLTEIKMFFNEYWWILIVSIFMFVMFTGRRIDRIVEWLTDRKMKRLYPKLTKKYDDAIFDYDEYLTELLGVNVRLDDLIKSVERINEEVFHNKVQRVTYLELWILVRTYGKRIVKSDEHIYYIDKKNLQKNLELDLKEVNRWVIEFVNSQEIRSLKIEASFLLHKIRIKDPSCDPDSVLQDSAIASVVFEKDYVFALRSLVDGESKLESNIGVIELKGGGLVEISETGINFVGNKSDMTNLEKIDVFSSSEIKKPITESIEVSSSDINKVDNTIDVKVDKIDSDGSVTYIDKRNRTITKKSKLQELKKTDMKTLFEDKDMDVQEAPVKVKAFGNISNRDSFKTLFDEQSQAEEILMQKFKPNKKENSKQETHKNKSEKSSSIKYKNFDLLRKSIQDGTLSLKQFFGQGGVVYFDEEMKKYLISIPHILVFIYELIEEKESMLNELFSNNSQPDQEKIYIFSKEIISTISVVERIERGSFHRAEEGYKEVYTFAILSEFDGEEYIEYIVRGKYDKKYKKYKTKVFAEQFLDLKN